MSAGRASGWRPRQEVREPGGVGRIGLPGRGEQPARVPGPRAGRLVGRPGVHRDWPLAVPVRATDRDLDLDAALAGQDQRDFQGELLDPPAPRALPGLGGQFHERRPR